MSSGNCQPGISERRYISALRGTSFRRLPRFGKGFNALYIIEAFNLGFSAVRQLNTVIKRFSLTNVTFQNSPKSESETLELKIVCTRSNQSKRLTSSLRRFCVLAKIEKISLAKDKINKSITKSDGRSNQWVLPLLKALVQTIGR